MSTEALLLKLGRVYIPPHMRMTENGPVRVTGYWRESLDVSPFDKPEKVYEIGALTPHQRRIAEGEAFKNLAHEAQAFDVPLDEYQAKIDGALKKRLAKLSLFTRTSEDALRTVLEEGRFKSLHETGYSSPGGLNEPSNRREAEKNLFGLPDRYPRKYRPIYGYPAEDDQLEAKYDPVDLYGDVAVKFKERVKERTTFSESDSLYFGGTGSGPFLMKYKGKRYGTNDDRLPKAIDPESTDPFGPGHWDDEQGKWMERATAIIPSPYNNPSFMSLITWAQERNTLLHRASHVGASSEIHIHGGVTANDIESVRFKHQPSSATVKLLEARGIPWSVAPDRQEIAASRLELARMWVPPYVRVTEDGVQHVDGYWREFSSTPIAEKYGRHETFVGTHDSMAAFDSFDDSFQQAGNRGKGWYFHRGEGMDGSSMYGRFRYKVKVDIKHSLPEAQMNHELLSAVEQSMIERGDKEYLALPGDSLAEKYDLWMKRHVSESYGNDPAPSYDIYTAPWQDQYSFFGFMGNPKGNLADDPWDGYTAARERFEPLGFDGLADFAWHSDSLQILERRVVPFTYDAKPADAYLHPDETWVPTEIDEKGNVIREGYWKSKADPEMYSDFSDDEYVPMHRDNHRSVVAAKEAGDQHVADMERVMKDYTGQGYFRLNDNLRRPGQEAYRANPPQEILDLDDWTHSQSFPQDARVYRLGGFGVSPQEEPYFLDVSIGDTFIDHGYVSTSANDSYDAQDPRSDQQGFIIDVPEGTPFGFGTFGEREMILPRDSVFKVISREQKPGRGEVFHLQLVRSG